jgi:hypothetical protein
MRAQGAEDGSQSVPTRAAHTLSALLLLLLLLLPPLH